MCRLNSMFCLCIYYGYFLHFDVCLSDTLNDSRKAIFDAPSFRQSFVCLSDLYFFGCSYADSQETCKGTHVGSFPCWCTTCGSVLLRLCRIGCCRIVTLMVSRSEKSTGGAVPALDQLASSSYHAAFSSSQLPPSSQDDKMHKSRTDSTL